MRSRRWRYRGWHAITLRGGSSVSRNAADSTSPRLLFVTGRLAEPALRRTVAELAPRAGFEPDVAVLPISVAALLTTEWVAAHLQAPAGTQRIVLPGFCRGPAADVAAACWVPAEHGPNDLRDLPEYFGQSGAPPADYGGYDIEILAEINSAPRLP